MRFLSNRRRDQTVRARGDQKPVPVTAALKTANFNFIFPDSSNTKIIRRGTLYCEPSGVCKFHMMTPDGVTSVE